MIISHKYKFIFIRVPKSASTSLQYSLGKICGNSDIVTPIDYNPPPDHTARNHEGYKKHMSAKKIKKVIPRKIWKNLSGIFKDT